MLTISPGWLAFTVNTWLVDFPYLQDYLASKGRWNLTENEMSTVSDF